MLRKLLGQLLQLPQVARINDTTTGSEQLSKQTFGTNSSCCSKLVARAHSLSLSLRLLLGKLLPASPWAGQFSCPLKNSSANQSTGVHRAGGTFLMALERSEQWNAPQGPLMPGHR